MKRLILSILITALLLLPGCNQATDLKDPVSFYYRHSSVQYASADPIITAELREGAGHRDNLKSMLDLYLMGPVSDAYISPFPVGTTILNVTVADNQIALVMNEFFVAQQGIDLTIACACLAQTCLELTGASSVTIEVRNNTINGAKAITLSSSDLVYMDVTNEKGA